VAQQKHAAVLVEPDERHQRPGFLHRIAPGADFDHQQAPRTEVPAGGAQYAPHQIETVPAAGEGCARLVPVLARQPPYAARRHVRRIADNEVVLFSAQCGKQVRFDEPDPIAQSIALPVDFRHGQRSRRDIGGVYTRAGKAMGEKNREATGPGAQVERRLDGGGTGNPRGKALAQQRGDVRARHDDALVHVETKIAEPGLAGQVGRGLAAVDAALEQSQHAPRVARADRSLEERRPGIRGQAQCVQREICGFVAGVAGAVAENETRRAKAAGSEAHKAAYRPGLNCRSSNVWF